MTFSIDIPDTMAEQMIASGKELSLTAFESLALEGYRNQSLSGRAVCELLGLQTSLDVHDFLWEHGGELNYDWEEWQKDKVPVDELTRLRNAESAQ